MSVFLAVTFRLSHILKNWVCADPKKITRLVKITGGVLAFIVSPLLACYFFFNPSENLLGNHDQGMYLAAGFNIQRTGSTQIALPLLSVIPKAERSLWLQNMPVQYGRQKKAPKRYWSLVMGFVLKDQGEIAGPAIPHFPPGFPVLCASFFDAGGWNALNAENALLMLFAACWLAILVSDWVGPGFSLIVVPFLVFNPLALWSANRFYAEPLVLFFWVGLVWCLHRSKDIPVYSGLAAVFATAAACITKVDAIAMVCFLGVMIVYLRDQPAWRWSVFFAGIPAALTVATILRQQDSRYLPDTLAPLLQDPMLTAPTGLILAAAIVLILLRPKLTFLSKLPAWLPTFFALITLGLFVYFYFLRAIQGPTDRYYFGPLGKEILSYRELTLQRLSWYFPYGGFWPLAVGITFAIITLKTAPARIFLLGGVASIIFLSYDVRCNPLQPYCMRRFLPYALPLLVSGAAFLIYFLKQKTRHWPLVVAIVLLLYFDGAVGLDRQLHKSREHCGMRTNLERLASAIPADATIVISSKSPLAPLAIPLRCIFGKEIYILQFDKNNEPLIQSLRHSLLEQISGGRRLFILDTSESFSFSSGLSTRLALITKWYTEAQLGSYSEIGTSVKSTSWRCVLNEVTERKTETDRMTPIIQSE